MANLITNTDNYDAIADAIRKCDGSTTKFRPSEMPNAIANIPDAVYLDVARLSGSTFETIDTTKFKFNNTGANITRLFTGCSNLRTIDFTPWSDKNVIDGNSGMEGTFINCSSLTNISGTMNFKTKYWDNCFDGCSSLTNLNFFRNFVMTAKIEGAVRMFAGCSSLTDVSGLNGKTNLRSANDMFINCTSLQSVDLSNWGFNNNASLSGMFEGCNNLTSIVSPSNVTVTQAYRMFFNCGNLQSIDLNWLTTPSNGSNLQSMFYHCSSLNNINMSNWTPKVSNISTMFSGCSSLTSLDLSNWDTTTLVDTSTYNYVMTNVFADCSSLTTLNLSSWDISNVTNVGALFYNCSSLQHLDIRSMDFSNITSSRNMFNNVPANCEIIVKDQAAKDWILNQRSDFTNIVIAS